MSQDLLFEIGCEELPPKALSGLCEHLFSQVCQELSGLGLAFDAEKSEWFGTPRRLAVRIVELATRQADRELERLGPAVAAAFDATGEAKPAAIGFARSCGVAIEALERVTTLKGERLAFRQLQQGQATSALLQGVFERALSQLPIPKKMRWGNGEAQFVRPVHWLVCLLGSEVVEMELFGLSAGNHSRGHRFHHPDPVVVEKSRDYESRLRQASVIVSIKERIDFIRSETVKAAETLNGVPVMHKEIVEEVANLVEWPTAVVGDFDEAFLEVPSECLISSMETHQRFFPVRSKEGSLLPCFVGFSNLCSRQPQVVRSGYEKVIRPRLADAMFFWTKDLQRPLSSYREALAGMVFQKQLGSLCDKSDRISRLAAAIAERLGLDPTPAGNAGLLCKCDLLSEMVQEFPELQGTMGRYYALQQGESKELAAALEEYYWPRFSGDRIATTALGRALGIADRIDSLTAIFAIGLRPTGNRDPFALRRSALAVLRTLIEGKLPLDLGILIEIASHELPEGVVLDAQAEHELIAFFMERLRGYCLEQGFTNGEFDAVTEVQRRQPLDLFRRLVALHQFMESDDALSLAAANKRIRNILKKRQEGLTSEIDSGLFESESERDLHRIIGQLRQSVAKCTESHDYSGALSLLAELREPIDRFFDNVMVMVENEAIRDNRLALLRELHTRFLAVADISLVN